MTSHVRTPKTAGLSDLQLSNLATKYDAKRADINALTEEANEMASALQKELDRRRDETVEVKGWRIKKRYTTIRTHDVDVLQRRVTRGLFEKVTKTVVDRPAFNAAVKLNEFSQEDLDAIETEKLSAPWIEVKAL